MTVAQRTESRVDDALSPSDSGPASGAEPLAGGRQDAWDGRVDAYLEEVDRQLATEPPTKAEPVRHLPPSEAASPPDVAPPSQAAPSGADARSEPLPSSMAISRYEELVSERLWETQPVKPTLAWRTHLRSIIAGALLVLLAALAMVAFFWRTLAPSTLDNVTLRPPAKERAVNRRPVAQEAPTHTLARSPQSTVPAPPPVPPRASIERTEPPAPAMIRAPAVTHTQAAAAAAVPARERATPRAPKPAANCSDAVTVLGLCSPDTARGNAR